MANITEVKKELASLADPKQARILRRFFKTGPGEYGEGDKFLGIKVPQQRRVVKKFYNLSLSDITKLLHSKIHEHRLAALLILVQRFNKGTELERKKYYDFYLKNKEWINNWDLVDLSAPNIIGVFLLDKPRTVLIRLAKSNDLWERRIAILATFTFIRQNDFRDAIRIAKLLLKDERDLIHKAVGWMLREIGKRDEARLTKFLDQHVREMPRTMLRYAIERLKEPKRQYYLKLR